MATYLEFMLEFYEDHYGAYCEYCYACDYDYQVEKKNTLATCYDNLQQKQYQNQQQAQQQAWQDYYQKNYGDMSQYYQQQNAQMNYQQQQGYNGYNVNNVNYNNGNNNGNRKLDGSYQGMYYYMLTRTECLSL
jgi:hypothetical protein